MQVGVDLHVTNVMPIYMMIAMNIVITMHFSINYPTVICLPTICYFYEREATRENYGPGVYFNHITKAKNTLPPFYYLYLLYNLSIYY